MLSRSKKMVSFIVTKSKRIRKDKLYNYFIFKGIQADLYELPDNVYGDATNNKDNSCFDNHGYDAVKGLQNISPCQFGIFVYFEPK